MPSSSNLFLDDNPYQSLYRRFSGESSSQTRPSGILTTAIASAVGLSGARDGRFLLAIVDVAINRVRALVDYVWEYARYWLVVTVEFDDDDDIYNWVQEWLDKQSFSTRASRFTATSSRRWGVPQSLTEEYEKPESSYTFRPSVTQFFTFKNRLMWVERSTKKVDHRTNEVLSISALGWSRSHVESLVREAEEVYFSDEEVRTSIYFANKDGDWRRTLSRRKRPMNSVIVPHEIKSNIMDDARDFLKSEQWYADRGIPYRRGYLFHGVPGAGKTSIIYSLAGEYNLDIYVINLNSEHLDDHILCKVISETAERCVVLIEDVDAAFSERVKDGSSKNGVSFSGLLNAIDGVAAQEGRILCMTTNHIERLDPALIRPGRIDVRVRFDNATPEQAGRLFAHFFRGSDDKALDSLAAQFAAKIPDDLLSVAQLQNYLMLHKQSPRGAIDGVKEWAESLRKVDTDDKPKTPNDTDDSDDTSSFSSVTDPSEPAENCTAPK